jgi:predicted AlkP superfamily pyrophosphatase or phosphodiesterase
MLATLVPIWMSQGYRIIVTADHGMSATGLHGGTALDERLVPLYIFAESHILSKEGQPLPQLSIAPLMCHYLGVVPSAAMFLEGVSSFESTVPTWRRELDNEG